MYTDSLATRNTVASQMRSLAQMGQPSIDIELNDQRGAYMSSYTTSDRLHGQVSITAPHDSRFDDIHITLEGSSKTFVENLSATSTINSRSRAFHTFLKLTQPITESQYPQPRVAEAGRTYEFPFTFVIPDQLLPTSCSHKCESEQLHQAHLQLPPSLGDPELAGDGTKLLDDMAPKMSRISYAIKVKITRHRESDGKEILLADKAKKLRIVPASEEEPPVNVEDNSRDYVMRREKTLKKGIFKGKLGRVSMEAAQPKAAVLAPPNALSPCPTTTMAKVVLRFDPASEDVVPPRLGVLASKLKANTYFASTPMKEYSAPANAYLERNRGLFSDTVPLSSRCVESAKWERHDAGETLRRDSAFSVMSTTSDTVLPKPSAGYSGEAFYTATLVVPVTLPKDKAFVPTFHSCLVARIYQLELSLSLHRPGSSMTTSTLHLCLPLQVSAASNAEAVTPAATAEREADAFFQPRAISVPSEDFLGTATALLPGQSAVANIGTNAPPGYSFFAGASHGMPVRIPSPEGFSPGCG
ncbi:MAG: hypothetical protein M1832_004968 [Thelocarpon impressellum]|nr:MAG: hypothetical protein M1832_004968 [Thelocarpon impressellum]